MKTTGIVRELDPLGRFVIPKELRDMFDLKGHDAIEIFTEGDSIVLKKFVQSCIFCGKYADECTIYRGKIVCPNCLSTLSSNQ